MKPVDLLGEKADIYVPSHVPCESGDVLKTAISQKLLSVHDALELIEKGPAVATGFADANEDPPMRDSFVQQKMIDAFSAATLWDAHIGYIKKSPEYLLLLIGVRYETIEKAEKEELIRSRHGSLIFAAPDQDRYLRAAMMMEGVESPDALTHRYKVRALNRAASPFTAIELYSFGLEKTSDHDYLHTLPLSEEDQKRAYILGTVAHEIGHKILQKLFGPSSVGLDGSLASLSDDQRRALTRYCCIVDEERSQVRRQYVSNYVLTHEQIHKSNAVLLAHEDCVEAIRIFLTNPQYLEQHYPRRFEYLQEYLPTLHPGAFSEIVEAGGNEARHE